MEYKIYLPSSFWNCPIFWQNFVNAIIDYNQPVKYYDGTPFSIHPILAKALLDYGALFFDLPVDDSVVIKSHNGVKSAAYVVIFPSIEQYTLFLLHWSD